MKLFNIKKFLLVTALVAGNLFLASVSADDNPLGTTLTTTLSGSSPYTNEGIISGNIYGINTDTNSGATVSNSGTIAVTGDNSHGISVFGDNSTITNSGLITTSGLASAGILVWYNNNGGLITNTSSGIITASGGWAIFSGSSLINHGSITSNEGTAVSLYCYDGYTCPNVSVVNTGTISGLSGISNSNITVNTLTNTGTISSIYNASTIGTLNNAQGGDGSTTALTYNGLLPASYNIIVNSVSSYGQLVTTYPSGSMAFGIYAGGVTDVPASILSKGTYMSVLSGISASNLAGPTYGNYNGLAWTLSEVDEINHIWNLIVNGNSVQTHDTQTALLQLVQALRGVYDIQSLAINNNLNNDCTLFDVHGICTSVTGTQNYLSGGIANDRTSGTLTVAYRVNDNLRIGAYLDQNLNTSNVTGVHLKNGAPAFGAFAVWNQNVDGLGTHLRIAAGYADKDLTVTRQAVQTSEAGTGTTNLNSYGVSVVGSYAMLMPGDITFSPYAGIRYTRVSADGYTEASSANVTAALTYSALTQNVTTALIGTKWAKHMTDNAIAYANIGLELDLSNNGGTYSASSTNILGLTPIAFNTSINKTRPVASIGAYYNIGDRQRVTADLIWSEQAFTSSNATSALVKYSVGF